MWNLNASDIHWVLINTTNVLDVVFPNKMGDGVILARILARDMGQSDYLINNVEDNPYVTAGLSICMSSIDSACKHLGQTFFLPFHRLNWF